MISRWRVIQDVSHLSSVIQATLTPHPHVYNTEKEREKEINLIHCDVMQVRPGTVD
jgi:hypothetical protein